MPIAFSYDEATNKVVVTGGTEGTPATFADFVTADRAGTAELLPATLCALNMTLTYQVRPVEDLAIQISFILAGTSAGAGDTLDITGTDWEGNAQNESIDVSAGDGTYNGSKKWRTITDIDCTGWADGTLQVTQGQWGVIWDYGNGQYQINAIFNIGDGFASTYFRSRLETVYFIDDVHFLLTASAQLEIGFLYLSYGLYPTKWSLRPVPDTTIMTGGTFEMAASSLILRNGGGILAFSGGTIDWMLSDISGSDGSGSPTFNSGLTSLSLDKINFIHFLTVNFSKSPTVFNDILIFRNNRGCYVSGNTTATGLAIYDSLTDIYTPGGTETHAILKDSKNAPFSLVIQRDDSDVIEQYTCNIHIADKDGADLVGVTVDCEDQFGNPVWVAGTITTNASGDIAEQTIDYKKWATTSETLTTYSPHKFTISKVGYETIILDNITVDIPIVWHLELLPATSRTGTLIATELDKDVSNQKIAIFDFDSTDNTGKTGDAGNITAQISIDGGAAAATNDTNPTELDATDAPGIYIFDLTQAETNGDMIVISAVSSTPNIKINPIMIRTKSYIERLSQRHHGI